MPGMIMPIELSNATDTALQDGKSPIVFAAIV
jgi:hypothetical protein